MTTSEKKSTAPKSGDNKRSQKKQPLPLEKRAAYTPAEFAAFFGKQKIWSYRQVYAGRLNAITGFGAMMIPATELTRIARGGSGE